MRVLKRVALIGAAILILAVAYRVLGVYRFHAGDCTAGGPQAFARTYPSHLVVMTYNIEGHAALLKSQHIAEIAETIRRYHPDVVGLNEAHRWTWQARFHDHVGELARLTGMHATFGRSYRFMGGEFGNAVLTRGTIVSQQVHELPGTGEPRTMLETVIRVNGGTIDFYVGHTSAWSRLGSAPRALQLRCMDQHVRASRYPFIVTGDLNAPPESAEVAAFLRDGIARFVGDPKAPSHKLMEQRLDYILTDPGWRVVRSQVLDTGPSDHRPVIAELAH
ncbi:MAG TPA: endonuclease/exonuclease/phosphatase family protein [Thermoanaerobaculia bacterium]|jgi:endonuclease/exonuclease/phosphatase family metal-dependent hydrolase